MAFRSAWKGASFQDVVSHWGAPANTTQLEDGRQAYTWVDQEPSIKVMLPTTSPSAANNGENQPLPESGKLGAACWRTLVFENGKVTQQTWHGPSTYCSNFARN